MRTPPSSAVPHQRVEDREQLPHARHQRNLLGLARVEEPLVELLDDGVVAGGDQRPHVQDGPHRSPSSPRLPLAATLAGVAVEGATPTRAHKRLCEMVSELGQLGQEGAREDSPDSRDAPEESLVRLEGGVLLDGAVKVGVDALDLLPEPFDVRPDALGEGLRGHLEAIMSFSETSISMSWRLLARMPCKARACSSGMTLALGSTALANRARTKASILSVASPASRPIALAKSLAWRGLTIATEIELAARMVAARRS